MTATNFTTVLTTFLAIFAAELPDKTMVASMVLSTRSHRPVAVWLGATAAFAVHVCIAVAAGKVFALLPARPVQFVVAALFAIGAVVLVREGDDDAEQDGAERPPPASAARVAGQAFVLVFLAEWGDLTQLATATLAAGSGDPGAVLLGALAALSAVSALAVLVGRSLLRVLPLLLIRRLAAALFALLAVATLVEAIRG